VCCVLWPHPSSKDTDPSVVADVKDRCAITNYVDKSLLISPSTAASGSKQRMPAHAGPTCSDHFLNQ
jgi:hypothetical protein